MLTVATGPRLGRFSQDGDPREISGHSLPLVAFGGMILWMGWFGFNGGSTLKAAAVGAVAVHGAAGIWGTIAAGLFKSGDLFNLALVKVQLIGIGAAFVWAFPMAFVTFKVINAVFV
jgi:Amt family ammonium transporter